MRRHLTYANVISTFCLVMVVGGGAAYAANTISSSDIINGQVKSVDIGTAAVATVDIAADAVDSSKIDDNTVTTADVANNSLRAAPTSPATRSTAWTSRRGRWCSTSTSPP